MQGVYSMKRLWPLLLAVVAVVDATGNAQTLRIRLLDGRSGNANARLLVWTKLEDRAIAHADFASRQ
jgi:hypothetical protein